MLRSDFDFELPAGLIAQAPLQARAASRLLHLAPGGGLEDRGMRELPDLLTPKDLLVFNDTRVIPARLFGAKESGGRVEILLERMLGGPLFLAQIRASKPPRAGMRIRVDGAASLVAVERREGEFYRLRLEDEQPALALFEAAGHMPLPPYIEREDAASDRERYQTLFAREPGAVAAPTAGLHFDRELLDAIAARGIATACVTLHVGAGTFQPMRVEDPSQHRMHAERYSISEALVAAIRDTRARGGRVVAIGTTVVRALESAALEAGDEDMAGLRAGAGETSIFILPGFEFSVVDALLTNFHLPQSTLLMLVSAFAGHARVMSAYKHAVAQGYRFFSYGDAMFIPARA